MASSPIMDIGRHSGLEEHVAAAGQYSWVQTKKKSELKAHNYEVCDEYYLSGVAQIVLGTNLRGTPNEYSVS